MVLSMVTFYGFVIVKEIRNPANHNNSGPELILVVFIYLFMKFDLFYTLGLFNLA
jgi:hypothetical protein